MQEIIGKLSNLIKDPAIERLDLTLSNPNFFEILKVSHTEIRHSNFLAWMLDPKQNHNIGDTFLKWFLKDIFSDQRVTWINEFKVDSLDTTNVVIRREYKNIDLLIETTEFVVVIENKLWSKEHSNQLRRYEALVKKEYPTKQHAFVFLTPFAEQPEQDDDKDIYVTFDYESIVRILNIILDTYGHSISEKIRTYMNDYILIVRRYIMQDDNAIKIAQEIYKNHKEALDFIFESKPDRLLEVASAFNSALEKSGYILGSPGKGYARFLTPELNTVIPKGNDGGWRHGEAFMFEIVYRKNSIALSCVVAPGAPQLRKLLIDALKTIEDAKNPKGLKWSSVHIHNHRINVNDEQYDDLAILRSDIEKILAKEKSFIEKVESALLSALEKSDMYS